jgi:hypothetical protein
MKKLKASQKRHRDKRSKRKPETAKERRKRISRNLTAFIKRWS